MEDELNHEPSDDDGGNNNLEYLAVDVMGWGTLHMLGVRNSTC